LNVSLKSVIGGSLLSSYTIVGKGAGKCCLFLCDLIELCLVLILATVFVVAVIWWLLSSDSDISTVSSSREDYSSASKQIQRHIYLRPRKLSLKPDYSLVFMEGLNFRTSDKSSELFKSFITLYDSLVF